MNKYIINRIHIQNFKSVDNAILSFNGAILTVLDGPNGFGKTTIYDAVEFVVTGKIRRVYSNSIVTTTRGFTDHLLSKNQYLPTVIKIEFINSDNANDRCVISREFSASTFSNTQKRPNSNDFMKIYNLYKYDSFESDKKVRISEEKMNELLSTKNLREEFSLFHYIEQDESAHLLKKNEKDRMQVISKLFNIETEMEQKKLLDNVKRKLVANKSQTERQIKQIEGSLNITLKKNIEKVQYVQLIKDDDLEIPWDKVNVEPLDKDIKEIYLNEIDDIAKLVQYWDEYKQQLKNNEIQRVIINDLRIKAIIIFSEFKDEYSKIEDEYKKQEILRSVLLKIKNKEIIHENIDWVYLFDLANIPIDGGMFAQRISSLEILDRSASTISKLVEKMNKTRESLFEDYKQYLNDSKKKNNDCPLCGARKNSLLELSEEIEAKSDELRKDYSESTKKINSEINEIYNLYVNELIENLDKVLEGENRLDTQFVEQLRQYVDVISDYPKALEWFKNLNIDITEYINKNKKNVIELDQFVIDIKQKLENSKVEVSDFCKENFTIFDQLYKNRFLKKENLLMSIHKEDLKQKKNYIEYLYLIQASKLYNEHRKLKKRLDKINDNISMLNRITPILSEAINKYRGKMISDVEIPFYIYSGKIIQNHQRGIGVFIKEEEDSNQSTNETQLKAITFVPPAKTDHDIIHSFSSGQISSTVIALTLAINKVYNIGGISTILIDDPVQTMDEMNMASFIELLRNDFNNKQIILSTHEDRVSLFMRYKFQKYSLKVNNINVKEHLYNDLLENENFSL
ncbi:hypothetical protein ASG89_20070 [Paenibacillus sp. Soil766]|uniref:ATP-binding protein n=1 Tax=Paenibacillus sp. Soil766 TaxID=1736404 RepID=UPI00070AE3CB|nr:AAA family ATPase [Paenibacillus sp. Soil766]KRF06042.1 hypothetical protein ASG89_20070 [Paenibacillus sp. Soil766]